MTRSAVEIAGGVRTGKASAREAVRASLDAIAARDGELSAFTQVFADEAMQRASAIDEAVAKGEDPGPLAGVPIAVKDNICTTLGRTTCASRFLEDYRSPFDATAVERLLAAGAVIVGKTNMDEFAMGSSGEHSCFERAKNPWAPGRVTGGSSSGSAAAVAAGMVSIALGSDTGGSIRQPASHCGVVGLKPSYGAVSRWGLVAFASSLDQIGPMTRTVEDAALALSVIAGVDPRDATSSARSIDALPLQREDVVRVGVPRGLLESADERVCAAVAEAEAALRGAGVEIVDIELRHADAGVAAYYVIAPAEASSNLARFDGVRYGRRAELAPGEGLEELYVKSRTEGFGAEVRRRILLGTHVLSSGYHDAYYVTAQRVRGLIKRDYDRAFAGEVAGEDGCAAVLLPAAPGPAFVAGAKSQDPMAMYLEDAFTVGANLAGLPGITLPVRTVEDDGDTLPIGVQLIGAAFDDARLLSVAVKLETALGWGARTA
ncbi:MAG: Asp-tRNA(Asn)/Glu-tRNA(Gln) amidotransferase subunit GatA [Planctomycetota bacterium]